MGKKSRQKRQKGQQTKPLQKPQEMRVIPTETALGSRLAQGVATPSKVVSSDDYSHIRGEIRRILLYMAVVAVVLSSAVILNAKSNILRNVGGKISSFLELQ